MSTYTLITAKNEWELARFLRSFELPFIWEALNMKSSGHKVDKIHALRNSKGLQYLVNAASKILGNPIYIHDMDYQLLVHTENTVTDDTLWNDMIGNGQYSRQNLELFADEYFFDAIANADTVTALTSDKLKYDCVLGKIPNKKHIMVACAHLAACHKILEDDDVPAFEALCAKISRIMNKDEYYQTYGQQKQEALINSLKNGTIEDRRLHSHSIADIYRGLPNRICVAVAAKPPESFISMLKQRHRAFKHTMHKGHIAIITGADDTCPGASSHMRRLQKLARQHKVELGISSAFENLFDLGEHYVQACAALSKNYADSTAMNSVGGKYLQISSPAKNTLHMRI